ncbi:MAG: dicarboxylate/amino acid:cation symporter, partial [Oscillospiraceae bacterium]|nr:dicarboxylate/amino acid:cation symporter [Oscillospiraceae bacterium]
MLTQKYKRYKFSPRTVDELSVACVEALTEANADKKDIIRVRLSLEEILESWLAALAGRDTHFRVFYRFGRKHIEICVEGPHAQDEGAEYANLFSSRLLAQSGIVPVFSYKNDCNYITISLPGPKLSSAAELVLSFTLPLVLGFLTRLLPGVTQEQLLSVTESLLEALLMLIKAVAIPMILFAVCISLMGMGDLRTMSQVGGPVIRRFLVSTLLIAVIAATVLIWCFPVTIGSSVDAEGYSGVYRLLLEILPPDIITPFKEGNALQIIFIGIVTGSGLLALGPRASALRDVVEQLGDLVNHIMGGFGKIMPVFVFLSVFNITVRGFSGNTDGIGKLLGIYLGTLI